MKISGNTILITGGSSGIGLALAKAFVSLGNEVIITGRDINKLAAAKSTCTSFHTLAGDLSKQADLDNLVLQIEQRFPTLNILINNAGVQYNFSFLAEMNVIGKISHEIETNLVAPIKLTSLLLPILCRNQNAAIVNVGSALALAPKKNASVYAATKAGIHSFTRTLRYQLEHEPVKVFELVPPLVDTAMTNGRGNPKMSTEALAKIFLQHFKNDRYQVYAGKAKLLRWMHRIAPSLAYRIMKNGS